MKYCFLAVDDEPLALQDLTDALHTAEPEAEVRDFTDPEEALAAVRKAIELNPTEDRLRENEKYILAALK